ncbi:aldo/keto reductase [Mycolicibacterium mengxianglii]|uniref:aldo/keto reductase n=1 Tax=Mycolicibacterium mengxianglii TaxID=2736649 RepID=UPI0027DA856E|nr:aldo/keto reductase [Mycolicibacterium mengxianglii]
MDLYLIHWPAPALNRVEETRAVLEDLYLAGLTKAIGVSNFRIEDLQRLSDACSTVPVVNQIELHPLFQQHELRGFQEARGIRTQAWGPLGQRNYDLGALALISGLVDKYGKSPQQITLRWHLQEGHIIFPKSTRPERMSENLDIVDFALAGAEMDAIARLDSGGRGGPDPAKLN